MEQLLKHSGCRKREAFLHSVRNCRVNVLAIMSLLFLLATGQSAYAWPTTWTIDSASDTAGSASDGDRTLRWALEQLADGYYHDSIIFLPNLDGQTILLESPINTEKSFSFLGESGQIRFAAAPGTSGSLFRGSAGTIWDFSGVIIQDAQGAGLETDGILNGFYGTVTNNRGGGIRAGIINSFSGTATNNGGGGIRADIIDSFMGTATDNSLTVVEASGASAFGGGVFAKHISWFSNDLTTTSSNTASATAITGDAVASGGGIHVDYIDQVMSGLHYDKNIADARTTSGRASAFGGGMSAAVINSGNWFECNFTENKAEAFSESGSASAGGGGFYLKESENVSYARFYGNSAIAGTGGSGSARAFGGGMSAVVISGTDGSSFNFTDNKAEAFSESGSVSAGGGGLYLEQAKRIGGSFYGNSAIAETGGSGNARAAGGGASGLLGGTDTEVSVYGDSHANLARATAESGAASAYGGGLDVGQIGFLYGSFTGNRAEAFSENGFAEAYGGGVFSGGVEILSASFLDNKVQAIAGDGGKAVAYGGAFVGGGDITLDRAWYFGNQAIASGADATAKGGALYLYNNGEQGSTQNVTLDASLSDIRFAANSVVVNGKTTLNGIHFASDKAGAYDTVFTITGNDKGKIAVISDGIHSEGAQGNTFHMVKKGDVVFGWDGTNFFEAMGGSTISFAEGKSNIVNEFTADAVHGNLSLELGANHVLNLDITERDRGRAFFSGLSNITLEEGTRLTVGINISEPNSNWANLGRWLFAEGTGWNMAQLNTMGFMTYFNHIWYSGGIFFEDANGLWLDLGNLTRTSATPIPGAVWLLGTGLAGVAALRRRMKAA